MKKKNKIKSKLVKFGKNLKRVKGNLWFVLVPAGGRNWSTFKCWPPSCPSLTWLVPTPSKGDLYCSHYLLNLCYDSYEVRTSCISACHAFMLFIVVLLVFWMCWLVDTVSPRRAVTFSTVKTKTINPFPCQIFDSWLGLLQGAHLNMALKELCSMA